MDLWFLASTQIYPNLPVAVANEGLWFIGFKNLGGGCYSVRGEPKLR